MAYRVLSLDGGGPWAAIEVMALIKMYGADTSGWDVLRNFDLVAANSAGSIVLGCLAADFPLSKTLELFTDPVQRGSMFVKTPDDVNKILNFLAGFGPKYSADAKLTALQNILAGPGGETLTDAIAGCLGHQGTGVPVRLLIVGFDYDRLTATFFRSQPAGGPAYGTGDVSGVTLAQAIDASTNAPVNYFDGPAVLPNGYRYWDGGITGCNNPVLVGVIEAISASTEFTRVVALSLGSGTVKLPWPQAGQAASPFLAKPSGGGFFNDLKEVSGSILDDPPDMATFVAHVMTGSGANVPAPADSQIVRMNPMISPMWDAAANAWVGPGGMSADDFSTLANLPMDAIAQEQIQPILDYATLWLNDQAPNQPIRMKGDTLTLELGQKSFSDALAAWNALTAL